MAHSRQRAWLISSTTSKQYGGNLNSWNLFSVKESRNMYALHLLRCLNNSFPTKLKTVVSSLKSLRRNYKPKYPSTFDLKSNVKNDVVLFRLEQRGFFLAITLFSAIQCGLSTYFAVYLFRVSDAPPVKIVGSEFWSKVLDKEREFSKPLSVFCLLFGWAVFLGATYYCTRSIRKIILHKDGKSITLVTYSLPGYNMIKLPLNNVSAQQHRTKTQSYITVKLKGKHFNYLIDIRGEFSNPTLFDFTVGVKRGF